jgi:hypothetical protein
MVNIKLDSKYSLISDRNNWMLAEGDADRLSYVGYYSNIENAVHSYVSLKTRLSDAKSIQELILYMKSLHATLCKALQPLNFELVPVKGQGASK